MLVNTPSIMSGSFPSFMSVFGSEDSSLFRDIAPDHPTKFEQHAFPHSLAPTHPQPQTSPPPSNPLTHRTSINSLLSDSTESSPTTTNSTFDSPLIADPSPSSSPESATSTGPLTSFQDIMPPSHDTEPGSFARSKQPPLPLVIDPPPAPQEFGKNVKSLSLNINLPPLIRPATASGVDGIHPLSAPSSPSKEPLRTGRKKPTNLTIRTPGFQQLSFAKALGDVPPTPSHRPTLHQYQSSPSLSTLASPTAAPAGGMHLPLPNLGQHSKQNSFSSHASSSMSSSLPDLQEEDTYQVPKSQEIQEKGYTEGPVQIYDSGVFLYLEPTAQEASKFDTVINVAKEIKNPFVDKSHESGTVMSVWRNNPDRSNIPEPQTAVSEISFKSAFEWPQSDNLITPTTPKQSSFEQSKQPEYIHVRWDHNSEILEDLFPLCQIIDERVNAGKKVLIHCQLGVSRSASLTIAYGLYKGYQPDFHSMYMTVKGRSRWVGPNMSLIYQLTDFRAKCAKGDYATYSKAPNPAWFRRLPDGAATPTAPSAPTAVNAASTAANASIQLAHQPTKRTPAPLRLNKALPPVPLFPVDGTSFSVSKLASPPSQPERSNPQGRTSLALSQPSTTVKRPASRPLPLRERSHISSEMSIPAHRPRDFRGLVLPQTSSVMDLAMNDVPDTPSLFSPRATEFMASPFGIKAAGDLAVPGSRASLMKAPAGFSWLPTREGAHTRTASVDPRSPHQHSEATEIVRHIDDFL